MAQSKEIIDGNSKLYSNRELLRHIEAMSWRLLYIFSFLWGGLCYLYATNPDNQLFSLMGLKINEVTTALNQESTTKMVYMLPLFILIISMILTLFILIYNMAYRKLKVSKKDEEQFIREKHQQLNLAIGMGSIISVIIVCFILLLLISPTDDLKSSLVLLAKIGTQLLIFVLLIWIPFRKFTGMLEEIKKRFQYLGELWNRNNNVIYLKSEKKSFLKTILSYIIALVYLFWLSLRKLFFLITKVYFMIMGIFLYLLYVLILLFHISKSPLVFLLYFLVFIPFMVIYIIKIIANIRNSKFPI
jgi:hypothetical protein